MKAIFGLLMERPGAGRSPVPFMVSGKKKKQSCRVPVCTGATVVLLSLFLSSAFAADAHSPHIHALPATAGSADSSIQEESTSELSPEKAGAMDVNEYPAPTAEETAAAFPDLGGMNMQDHMGGRSYGKFLLDRLEAQDAESGTARVWDARASWGSAFNRLWLTSEGEREEGATAHLQSRLYASHAFSRWWEATAGLRQDGGAGPDRTWAGVGVQGLAPYFLELQASAWIGEGGRTALALDAEHELLLSNRLILQSRLEMNAYGKDDADKGIGSGLSDAEFALRLRYEIRREIAPYVGVEWSRRFGATADMATAHGERSSAARALAGIRLWF